MSGTTRARQMPALGSVRRGKGRDDCGMRRIVIALDDDTFEEVRDRAVSAGTSFAEQIRLLVDWGLMAAESEAVTAPTAGIPVRRG